MTLLTKSSNIFRQRHEPSLRSFASFFDGVASTARKAVWAECSSLYSLDNIAKLMQLVIVHHKDADVLELVRLRADKAGVSSTVVSQKYNTL